MAQTIPTATVVVVVDEDVVMMNLYEWTNNESMVATTTFDGFDMLDRIFLKKERECVR